MKQAGIVLSGKIIFCINLQFLAIENVWIRSSYLPVVGLGKINRESRGNQQQMVVLVVWNCVNAD